jgi:hypothetical protein
MCEGTEFISSFIYGMNQQRRLFLYRRHNMILSISEIEYTSILAEIRHQTDFLDCLYWVVLIGVGCSFCLSVCVSGLVWSGLLCSGVIAPFE